MNPNLPLILLTKEELSDEQLDELKKAGVFGIGPQISLLIKENENRRSGYSDLVDKAHQYVNLSDLLKKSSIDKAWISINQPQMNIEGFEIPF